MTRSCSSRQLSGSWINPVFSYDKDKIRNADVLIKETSIYISTGYSAFDSICFIRELLKKYDLDLEEDFIYSARQLPIPTGINRLNIARSWCEKRHNEGVLNYDQANSKGQLIRFKTPLLNSIIPESKDKLSPCPNATQMTTRGQ